MSCWLCTQCTPSKKAVLQCRGASTVGFSKALAPPKHPTGSWKRKIPHTSPVVYQYSKDVKRYKKSLVLVLWFFDCLAPKIFLQFHNLNSPGTTTAPASLSGTCHHWRWRWHWKNLRPVYFHCMTCMIACNSSITAVKTACIIEARIKELILFSRCKLQKCYITLQFSPCTLVRPQKLQRPSAALSSPCASKLTIADPQIQIKLSRIWQRIDKGKLKKTAKTWRRSSAMAWQRSNSVAGSETRSRCSRAYQLWNQNLKMSDQNVAKCM